MPRPRKNSRKPGPKSIAKRRKQPALGFPIVEFDAFRAAIEAAMGAPPAPGKAVRITKLPFLPDPAPDDFIHRRHPEPRPLDAPEFRSAGNTATPGEVLLRWTHVPDHVYYELQISECQVPRSAPWVPCHAGSRNHALVKGLISGHVYHFRVVAVGRAGRGPASESMPARPD
jgi:hypothetical protein